MDITAHLEAKSDQLNNVDLIAGDLVITITKVNVKEKGADQPVAIHYEGDNGKPFKPCKNMMRVLAACYSSNSALWVGKRVRLYRDPEVIFGKSKTGGIRISHLSDIKSSQTFTLQFRRRVFTEFTVQPLTGQAAGNDAPPPSSEPTAEDMAEIERLRTEAKVEADKGSEALKKHWTSLEPRVQNRIGGKVFLDELKKIASAAVSAEAVTESAATASVAGDDVPFDA